MSITVLFFGQLSEKTGQTKIELDFEGGLDELDAKIRADFPKIAAYNWVRALNQEVHMENVAVSDGDEVAFMPPFAGG